MGGGRIGRMCIGEEGVGSARWNFITVIEDLNMKCVQEEGGSAREDLLCALHEVLIANKVIYISKIIYFQYFYI